MLQPENQLIRSLHLWEVEQTVLGTQLIAFVSLMEATEVQLEVGVWTKCAAQIDAWVQAPGSPVLPNADMLRPQPELCGPGLGQTPAMTRKKRGAISCAVEFRTPGI